jgi:lysophospholipase-1
VPPQRDEPIVVHASQSSSNTPAASASALIFLHGLGDDATGWENIAHQFQRAAKLPHMTWIFPNALENHDAMQRAWYVPTALSPFQSQRPELDDPEDEEGLLQSVAYVESLIDDLVDRQGVPVEKIFVGGFSQGCAVALLTGLCSKKYAGRIGGVLGLCGYLPLGFDRIKALRSEVPVVDGVAATTKFFYMRGSKDMLVPQRYYRMAVEGLRELGVRDAMVTAKVYDNLGHTISGQVLREVCDWLQAAL